MSDKFKDLKEVLRSEIKKIVKVTDDKLQPGERKEVVTEQAVEQILVNVSEFYFWVFNKWDERSITLLTQNSNVEVSKPLLEAVSDIVKDNIEVMNEADEIPASINQAEFENTLTNSLSWYIVNWEDWYWDFREDEALRSYLDLGGVHNEIYLDSEYGNLKNYLDNSVFDGISDVPYISE